MPKTVKLDPINEKVDILTNDNLLSGLLAKDLNVWKECGGRGMCSTCHVLSQMEWRVYPLLTAEKFALWK